MVLIFCVTQPLEARRLSARKINMLAANIDFANHPNLNKTHFIVGYPKTTPKPTAAPPQGSDPFSLKQSDGAVKKALFAPDDAIKPLLLYLINQEQGSIKVAIFNFTESDIAQALIKAKERGVEVEVVADPGCADKQYSKITLLREHGIAVYIYDPEYSKKKKSLFASLMHNKTFIFQKNFENRSLLFTGSLNITKNAHMHNQENIIVSDDAYYINKFLENFQLLKQRSLKKKVRRTR